MRPSTRSRRHEGVEGTVDSAMIVGLVLILISLLLMAFIIRTVQANLPKA
jgi:hypothetical protein